MSYQNENFGMMDEGYFVPRTQILTWINNLLQLNLTKIQQLGSGAVYCQIVDVIHPGKVALSKLNWKARNDYQFINNLKVLQSAFDKIGIKRHVEVQKLAKAKYQDNLEFIQWMKRYYDLNCGERGNNYLPEERRGNVVIDFSFAEKNVVPKTYNGSGVVKSQVFEPKKAAKKQQAPPVKIKSPMAKKVQTKRVKSPPHKGKGTTTTLATQKTENSSHNQEKIEAQKKIYQEQVKKLEEQIENNKAEIITQRDGRKQSEIKLQMIQEIIKGQDAASMKISLIEEILNQ